jgi:uncharacterized protein YkwD
MGWARRKKGYIISDKEIMIMKKLPIIYLSALMVALLALAGCGGTHENKHADSSVISVITDNSQAAETDSAEESTGESTPNLSESLADSHNTTSGSQTGTSSVGTSSKPPSATPSKPSASDTPSQPPSQTSSVTSTAVVNAQPSDAEAIADKLIEYINQYRVEQSAGAAAKLPGLTQVAQYRGKQLVTNYAHDIFATQEATRFYQYGDHIVYGELDYYDAHTAEAIGSSGGNAPISEIAERMANGFRNSAAHWSYVGASEYNYIAVGASYGNGQWYICILMSNTNEYEK